MTDGKRSADSASAHHAGDNKDERPTKRTRVTRACDQCRAGREKCDGAQPECQTCASQERSCTYNEPPKKRGIQPNYIRTLELTLAWVFQDFPDVETTLSRSLSDINGTAHHLINGKDADSSERLHQFWRGSIVNRQIDQMLSGTEIEPGIDQNEVREPHQPKAKADAVDLHISPSYGQKQITIQTVEQDVDLTQDNTYLSDRHPSILINPGETSSNQTVQLPENAWLLLEYYCSFTHSWLPMTDKHRMLKLMYCYPTEGLSRSQITVAEHTELWSILALASHQMRDHLPEIDAHQIKITAESMLPTTQTYENPHIKAMILLSLIDMTDEKFLAAWLRVGTVIRMLKLFNLLQNLGSTDKWCRHIHLAAFIVENALSQHFNTQGHITATFIKRLGFVDEDGLDEWSPWTDPLQPMQPGSNRAPSRAFSTLNQAARHALRSSDYDSTIVHQQQMASRSVPLVFLLLRNANAIENRTQPFKIVSCYDHELPLTRISSLPGDVAATNENNGFSVDESVTSLVPTLNTLETAQSIFDSPLTTHSYHGQLTSPFTQQSLTSAAKSSDGLDIFEELAALEGVDTEQNTDFLRNLGFAPDLDLAEFFGDDYQFSDPFLAYLLPPKSSLKINS